MQAITPRAKSKKLTVTLSTLVLAGVSLVGGCSSEPAAPDDAAAEALEQELGGAPFIWPGRFVGAVRLGMTYAQVKAALGPATAAFGANNVMIGVYPARGLDIVFASTAAATLSDDARVVSIGTSDTAAFTGFVRPGERRDTIELRLGKGETSGDIVYYPFGVGIVFDKPTGDDAIAKKVSVFAPYWIETQAPEMRAPFPWPRRSQPLALAGKSLGTVDMHLHPGFFGRIPATTKGFFANAVPPFLKAHLPALSSKSLDPWAPILGIKAQTEQADVDHAVLFAVYTQKTTGYFTNEDLEGILTDPRNRAADGLPWAFGFASVNFFDGYVRADGTVDTNVARWRLAALSGYFERRRDVFIGIKLAHAHQGVAFDDARYLGVYDVAAKHRVPVYVHTGFTPFPGGTNLPAYYDPQGLENTIRNTPNVTFVLGHVGQGDPAAVEHCLALAKTYPNVYLEISALNRPLLLDDDGDAIPPDPSKPQYPYVIAQVKARGLVQKTLFGTDGPQSAGMVKGYVGLVRQAMVDEGYTPAEIADVMGKNFERVYFPKP